MIVAGARPAAPADVVAELAMRLAAFQPLVRDGEDVTPERTLAYLSEVRAIADRVWGLGFAAGAAGEAPDT